MFSLTEISGMSSTMSQLSLVVRPVLVPPWNIIPAPGRALSVTSIPSHWRTCLP